MKPHERRRNIINRIKADSDESVAAIRLKPNKQMPRFWQEAEKQAQRREAIADKTRQNAARRFKAASKSRAELETRTALLKQRRAEIDKTAGALLDYLTGLGDNDYFNALYRLAAQLRGKSGELLLNQKDLNRLPRTLRKESGKRDSTPASLRRLRTSSAVLFSKAATLRRTWTLRRFSTPAATKSRISSTAICSGSKEAPWLYHTNIPSAPSAREKSIC